MPKSEMVLRPNTQDWGIKIVDTNRGRVRFLLKSLTPADSVNSFRLNDDCFKKEHSGSDASCDATIVVGKQTVRSTIQTVIKTFVEKAHLITRHTKFKHRRLGRARLFIVIKKGQYKKSAALILGKKKFGSLANDSIVQVDQAVNSLYLCRDPVLYLWYNLWYNYLNLWPPVSI